MVVREALAHLQDFEGFPVAVWGRVSTNSKSSGIHHLAIFPWNEARSSGALTWASHLSTTTSRGRSSHFGCFTPITAAWATAGCAMASPSMSIELIHSPPDLITSLERSVIFM